VPIVDDQGLSDIVPGLALSMGERNYRRSELSWNDAGAPTARVHLRATPHALVIDVAVRKADPLSFAPARERNDLDNEPSDINSDGVQIHLADAAPGSPSTRWLLVPVPESDAVRVDASSGAPPMLATWRTAPGGYALRCEIALTDAMRRDGFDLDVIVNEISPDRERRRGQLVLSGSSGDWVYLRGDRQPRETFLSFVLGDRAS
jgi:hypothetical protein